MFFIGIIIVLFGLFMFYLRPNLAEQNEFENGELVRRKAPPFFLMFSNRISLSIAATGVLFMLLPYMFFWAEPGYQYFLVYPTGKRDVVMNQGITFRGFAKVVPWQKYIDVKVISEGDPVRDIEGIMKPIPIRFIDQVTAEVKISGRFQLPTDEASFITLAIKYRTMENLVQNTLIPTIREQTNNTGTCSLRRTTSQEKLKASGRPWMSSRRMEPMR